MKCPNCGTYGRLKAEQGTVPISKDEISCEECKYVFTQEEKNHLEIVVIEQRRVW
jgi:phage terminase large subunit GpA-like protein